MSEDVLAFESAPVADRPSADALIVDVDGYEGPLDVLLMLSRTQKVDLRKISVLDLAVQYLGFVEKARALRIELAADYLVMAAWLAFLKSRLLLPPDPADEGPSGAELATHLAFQLERLQAMREAAARIMGRDQKGRDFFARGLPEGVARVRRITHTATLLDLMQAYARIRTRDEFRLYSVERDRIMTMKAALERLRGLIGFGGEWNDLISFLPEGWDGDAMMLRSATASTFAASLELAKLGQIELRQGDIFSTIEIRKVPMVDEPVESLFEAPSMGEQERMVEAILFASAEPVSVADMNTRMPHGADAANAVAALQKRYDGRGVAVVQVGNAWAIRTAADLGFLMRKETVETRKLSRAAIETLAIIAYHQPVTRAEIEEIRGVSVSRGTVDQLLELEWVRFGRRRMTPGRPATFVVTPGFLDHFGLESARDLPGLQELRAAGLLENRAPPGVALDLGGQRSEDQSEMFEED